MKKHNLKLGESEQCDRYEKNAYISNEKNTRLVKSRCKPGKVLIILDAFDANFKSEQIKMSDEGCIFCYRLAIILNME